MLFGKSTTLESDVNAIAIIHSTDIAVADVRVPKSEANRFLTVVTKEAAQFSQTAYGGWPEAELLSASLASYVDVEVIEAIVAIKTDPHKANNSSGVADRNLGAIPHG